MMARTLSALIALSIGTAAQAADLGGNCCADLEERVAELEATVARKGNRKVSLEVSGHVNEAILYQDGFGADRGDWTIVPATNSQSRFRFKGEARINANWSAGFLMEFGVGGFDDDTGETNRNIATRHSALYVKSNQLGTVWLGHTSQATDGITEISLASGAQHAYTQMSVGPVFDALGAPAAIGDVVLNWDGSRQSVLKYVSPTVGGFVLSASWSGSELTGDDDEFDVALRYAGEFGAIRVAAGVGYRAEETDYEGKVLSGSLSVMHTPSGLFVNLAGAQNKGDDSLFSTRAYWVTAGVEARSIAAGKTTIYAEYGDVYDIDVLGFNVPGQHNVYGVGISQDIDAAALTIYAGYRHYKAEALGLDDADTVIFGAKISF